MNITEFCAFFDFSVCKVRSSTVPIATREDCDLINDVIYIATDDQGVFQERYGNTVADLADQFDSMHPDYIDITLDDFDIPHYSGYKEAIDYIDNSESEAGELFETDTYMVMRCIENPALLVDDAELDDSEDRSEWVEVVSMRW